MNAMIVLTTSLVLSATILVSHASGRLASQAPSPQLSEPAVLTPGSETVPQPSTPLPGVEHDE